VGTKDLVEAAAENGETLVRLDAEIDLPAPAAFVPQLARRAVRHGVDDNLATLKAILEAAPSADRQAPDSGDVRRCSGGRLLRTQAEDRPTERVQRTLARTALPSK
jgi:hypothetical protein